MDTRTFTREQAKQADHELYDAMMNVARKNQSVSFARSNVDHVANRRRLNFSGPYNMTREDAEAEARNVAATDDTYVGRQAAEAIDKLESTLVALAEAKSAVRAADKWEDNGMWNRYAVVPGGHIHTEMGCFTLRPTTDVRWAYQVSGDSVEDAIAMYGDALCTHCFPNAPVAQTASKIETDADGNPITKAEADAVRAARLAEKNAKLAAKNAKRVIDPNTNDDVRDEDNRPLKTEVAVRNEILRLLSYGGLDRVTWRAERRGETTTRGEVIEHLVKCLALKRGVDAVELRAEFDVKNAKKR